MTNNIYPPDHLLRKWEELIIDEEQNVDVVLYEAFQAGADQELDTCCEWLRSSLPGYDKHYADYLHAARRPKPPSLKEQALQALDLLKVDASTHGLGFDSSAIRRALESLPD
jgi:hypothetical protein